MTCPICGAKMPAHYDSCLFGFLNVGKKNKMIRIVIPGNPIAKKRPRFARRGKFVTTYSDQQTKEGKFIVLAQEQIRRQIEKPLEGPLHLYASFQFPRPKSHFGTGKNANKLKPSAPVEHIKKPDLDNCEKFLADCLNGIAWNDDSQIVISETSKCYATSPRTVIFISEA